MLTLSRAYFFALFVSFAVVGCTKVPAEKALRDTIEKMASAVEARDASAFMKQISASFRAQSNETGELDRDAAKRTLAGILLAYPNIKIGTTVRELKIDGKTARTLVEVIAGGGANALPDSVRHFSFTLDWVQDGSDWKLSRAQWER